MIDRYEFTKQANQKYNTAVFPNFEYRETDYYLFSREGDRLDSLAYQFYQDVSLWWIIANANNLGKGSVAVPPGLQIRIPYPIDSINTRLSDSETGR